MAVNGAGRESPAGRFFEISVWVMLASGYMAIAGSGALDAPSLIATGAALAAKALKLARVVDFEVPARLPAWLALGYILFFPIDYYYLSRDLVAATVHLVLFLAVVKIVTATTARDFVFLGVIAFLEILSAALFSLSPSFFVFLVVFLTSAVASMASGEIKGSAARAQVASGGAKGLGRRLGWTVASVTAGVLVLTAGLFLVLPRTARAAFERFARSDDRETGFAREVTLGQLGELRKASRPVMHVYFDPAPPKQRIYWRGAALGEFNGWKWYNSAARPEAKQANDGLVTLVDDDQLRRVGPRINYEVVQHVPPSEALFVAGLPERLRIPSPMVWQTRGGGLRLPYADRGDYRFQVYSFLGGPDARDHMRFVRLPEEVRTYHLLLPPVDRRIIALAQKLTAGRGSDIERARAIEKHLAESYAYSLARLEREVEDPLAYFLFDRKKGHCEYFASAMAVMLRSVWIPSRVVTGFLEGSYNPLSGWQVVRASDAHSWVEAWIPGKGWTVFDPTPPAAEAGGMWESVAMWADAAEVFWQEWVIGYDMDRQLTLAFRVGQGSKNRIPLPDVGAWMAKAGRYWDRLQSPARWPSGTLAGWVAALAGAGVAGWFLVRLARRKLLRRMSRGEASQADASVLYRRLMKYLRKRGFAKDASATPMEFACSIRDEALAVRVVEFTKAYNELRFSGRLESASRMAELLDTIEQTP